MEGCFLCVRREQWPELYGCGSDLSQFRRRSTLYVRLPTCSRLALSTRYPSQQLLKANKQMPLKEEAVLAQKLDSSPHS